MDNRLRKLELKTLLTALADFFLPRVCVVCGRMLIPAEKHICLECLEDLPLTRFEKQSRNPMADRLNAALPDEDRYAYATALFFYSSGPGYDNITKALKYRGNLGEGRYFASMLGKRLALSPHLADVDAVVCVPLHPLRRWRRGYNQAEVIGKSVAAELGVPLVRGAIRRKRRTDSQTTRNAEQRRANLSGAFASDGKGLEGYRHILIVDDVFTTGATLASCLQALRAALGKDVRLSVATLACVE